MSGFFVKDLLVENHHDRPFEISLSSVNIYYIHNCKQGDMSEVLNAAAKSSILVKIIKDLTRIKKNIAEDIKLYAIIAFENPIKKCMYE